VGHRDRWYLPYRFQTGTDPAPETPMAYIVIGFVFLVFIVIAEPFVQQ
jgi:hypothetical protein